VLSLTDMRDNPERFFLAHRLLSRMLVDGFGIRFTVQFNLFAGSILGLGGEEQVARLEQMQEEATLGCFALTERGAGVSSGLVVNTTATWCANATKLGGGTFVLNTPNEDARKFWISQGLTATEMVVVADLIVHGKSHGPHAFVMPLRDAETMELTPGISVGDMGHKTIANDLDNAWLSFDHVEMPCSAILSRFCEIKDDVYMQRGEERMRIEVIGQRLLTGRMCIAQAALVFARAIFASAQNYAAEKPVWQPVGEARLDQMPQLRHVFDTHGDKLSSVEKYCSVIEAQLCDVLRTGAIPSERLVEQIAVSKVCGVRTAIEACRALQSEVGSFALLGGSGFESMDMLLCCKFAEGDERILLQKMARDKLMGQGPRHGWRALAADLFAEAPRRREALKALSLALAMKVNTPGPNNRTEYAKQTIEVVNVMPDGVQESRRPTLITFSADDTLTPPLFHNTDATVAVSAGPAAGTSSSNTLDRKQESKAAMVAAWAESWQEVYALANAICARHIAEAKADADNSGVTYEEIGQLVMPARL